MSKRERVVLLLLLFSVVGLVAQQSQSRRVPEGMMPFQPTRLEWLTVLMNASSRVSAINESGFDMDFLALEPSNTLVIRVGHVPTANKALMNAEIYTAKQMIAAHAELYGWTSWLKVREEIQEVNPSKKK